MLGSKISVALENNNFAVSFIHLQLRRDHKEDYIMMGESKAGIGLQDYVLSCLGHATLTMPDLI